MTISVNEMSALAAALVSAEHDTDEAEKFLKAIKERERVLREETIPSAMQELGIEKLVLETGETLSLKQEVYAQIPAAQKPAVFAWLDEHGFGGLVKTELSLEFGREERDEATKLANELRAEGFLPSLSMNVHSQTLKAFIKEQLATGKEFPLDLFGARAVFEASVKAPKGKTK